MKTFSSVMSVVVAAACVFLGCGLQGCTHTKPIEALAKDAEIQPPPRAIERPMGQSLQAFGKMIRAYKGITTPQIVEVDLLPNDSGITKELPSELGYYAVSALANVGEVFRTTRTYPTIVLHGTSAASGYSFGPNTTNNPRPTVKLKGQLLGASSRVEKSREGRVGVQANIGSGTGNADFSLDDRNTLVGLRVGYSLTTPDGVSLPGPTACYEVLSKTAEDNMSLGLYFDGTGGGYTSKVVVTHDVRNAISDATGACIMQLIGHWLMVPYYRCDSSMPVDNRLRDRVWAQLRTKTTQQLEAQIKVYLFGLGLPMDSSQPDPTPADHALILKEMQRQGLTSTDQLKFCMKLWDTLDFEKAADRIDDFVAQQIRGENERKAKADQDAIDQAAKVDPAAPTQPAAPALDFGWPANTPYIIVDLAALTEENQRNQVLKEVRAAEGYKGDHPDSAGRPLYGVHFTGTPLQLHGALVRAESLHGIQFIWTNSSHRLVATPRNATLRK